MARALPLLLLPLAGLCLRTPAVHGPWAFPEAPVTDTAVYVLQDSLHMFTFHIERNPEGPCRALVVDVAALAGGPVQHVLLNGMAVPCPDGEGRLNAVEVTDLNFDGMREFRVMRADTDMRIPNYRYWLYDPLRRTYAHCPQLDSVQHPNFDRERHMVGSQWYRRKGLRGSSTFRIVDGRLQMLANMEKYTEGDHERWVIWGQKDGRLQPVQERIVPLTKH